MHIQFRPAEAVLGAVLCLIAANAAATGYTFGDEHSSVTLYGVLDAGLLTTDHGMPDDPNGGISGQPLPATPKQNTRVTGTLNGGLTPTRLGLTGQHEMRPGLIAEFTLESPLNLPYGTNPNGRISDAYAQAPTPYVTQEGSLDGQTFARESTIGLKFKDYGELRFGRQLTVMADSIIRAEPTGGYLSPIGFNGGYTAGGFTAENRWDQSFKYTLPVTGDLTALAGYGVGGTTGGFAAGSAASLGLRYRHGPLEVAGVWVENKDAQLAGAGTTVGTLSVTFGDTHAFALLGVWDLNPEWTFKGGWERIYTDNPSNPGYDQKITDLQGITVTATNVAGFANPRVENMYWLGSVWSFAPDWQARLGVYERTTNAYGASATAATMAGTSTAKYVTLQLIESFTKNTDLYLAVDKNGLTGPVWHGYEPTTAVGIGMRYTL